jgi:hypothetical protein
VPIDVVLRDRALILNTRSAQALQRAGIPVDQWEIRNKTGDPASEGRVNGQLTRNRLSGRGIDDVYSTGITKGPRVANRSKRPAGESAPSSRFLFELPYEPREVEDESRLLGRGTMELVIPLRREGVSLEAVMEFSRVRSYRYTTEALCTPFQIAAYDKLVDVDRSPWIAELLNGSQNAATDEPALVHFMIYIADEGCYEFAAHAWRYFERPVEG